MATILNRSRFTVSAKRNPELKRTFAFSALKAARAYLADLRAQGHKAALFQADDRLVVRIRQKGHVGLCFPASSYADAETAIKRIESERETGLFIDYRAGHRVAFAALLAEYIEDPGFRTLKGYADYKTTLKGMLADSVGELARALEERTELVAAGSEAPTILARRTPRRSMTWMQARFAAVKTPDIQTYIHDRLDDGIMPSNYPQTTVQTCIVHLIRNSLDYAGWKDRKALAAALRPIYRAASAEAAAGALESFAAGPWGAKYPTIAPMWRRVWERVVPFFAFPPAVRKVIYTTNAIENLHMRLRKIIKTCGHFPSDEAATKRLWLALRNALARPVKSAHEWKTAMTQFAVLYGERFTATRM